MDLIECVINVSEGRDRSILDRLASSAAPALLDLHSDAHHNRSVFTLAGPGDAVAFAARSLAEATVELLDIRSHSGVHPRIGVLDVVPWIALAGSGAEELVDGDLTKAVAARDLFAIWAADELGLPCFKYGPDRSLPELRRRAWRDLFPDTGPPRPHPSAGATAVGARPILVAYNLWLDGSDLLSARGIASGLRGPHVRSLGLPVGDAVQVSCNLIAPWLVGPGAVFDYVASRAPVACAELVGLLPAGVLDTQPRHRWPELGLSESKTIEARLQMGGPRWGKV